LCEALERDTSHTLGAYFLHADVPAFGGSRIQLGDTIRINPSGDQIIDADIFTRQFIS